MQRQILPEIASTISSRLGVVGMLQQRMRGQDHARRAVAALQTVGLAERILNDAEFARGRRETFDRGDLVAIGLHREHQT